MKNISTSARPPANLVRKHNTDRYVDVGGTTVRYIELGREHGGVPLLMLHGYNGSAEYWYPYTLPGLAAERCVIALDLPGNGWSGRLPEHSLEAYADFIPRFLNALGIEQVDLLGHSMGGQVAIATVTAQPDRFRRLILVDSAGLPELVKEHWLAPFKMLTDASLRHVGLYPSLVRIGMRARSGREGLAILRSKSIRRHLQSMNVPTLVIWGSRDRVVPLEHGAFMAEHIPGARLAIIRGAGHMPFYQKPEQFNRLVLSFLR